MNDKILEIREMMEYRNYGRINTSNTTFTDPQTNNSQTQYNNYIYPSVSIPSNSFAPTSATTNNGTMDFDFGINGSMRKRTDNSTQKTEYYLFNAFDQMKAYSNNGETYGYYGYDAGGQRTYKMILNTLSSNTNTFPNAKVLDVEKVQMYPNGYINLDQHGNYTKHYYADATRIASKIGGGFDSTIVYATDSLKTANAYETMLKELGEVTNDTIDDIIYSFEPITHLIGEGSTTYEDGLYFYHGNHLSSTQLITDLTGNITQAILYEPWGSVISEYNSYWHQDIIPNFTFNSKPLDEESGMLDYVKRMYDPKYGGFISRDPKFEKYWWISPYAYCANNPLRWIDPTGESVEITGTEKQAAFEDFKAGAAQYNVKVKMNKDGQISGKYTGKKGAMSNEAKEILGAIKSKSVNVKIEATSTNTTAPSDGSVTFFGGGFLGSTLSADGSTATARQIVNPADLKAMDDNYAKPQGTTMLHEVMEAYYGGVFASARGLPVSNSATSEDAYNTYKMIHNATLGLFPQAGEVKKSPLYTECGLFRLGYRYHVGSYYKNLPR